MAKTDSGSAMPLFGSDFIELHNIVAATKLSLDRLFFMVDGIFEKLDVGHSNGLKEDCSGAIPALDEFKRAMHEFYRLEEELSRLTSEERADLDSKLSKQIAFFEGLFAAAVREASLDDLRRLVDAFQKLCPELAAASSLTRDK